MKLTGRDRLWVGALASFVFVALAAALWLDFLPRGFLSNEGRAAAAWLTLAFNLFCWVAAWVHASNKADAEREQKRQEREAQQEERRLAAAAEEQKRLDAFKPFSTSFEVNGETFHVAWGGPLETITDAREARTMEPAFFASLYRTLCRHHDPLQPTLAIQSQGAEVYETDERRTWKGKLRSPEMSAPRAILRVAARTESSCKGFCPWCYQISNDNFCPDCSRRRQEEVRIQRA